MATALINTATVIAATISTNGDGLIINDLGRITLNSVATAINVNALNAELIIAGNISTLGSGIVATLSDTSIVITDEGRIDAALDGITLLNFADIMNDGTISGLNTGITAGGSATIVNTGTITGSTDAIKLTGQFSEITNAGTITAKEDGIELSGDRFTVTNSGLIAGGSVALRFLAGAVNLENIIINNGTISGAIFGDVCNEIITNRGTMSGVLLGDGNDSYDGSAGVLIGFLNMGSGDDEAFGGSAGESFVGSTGHDTLFGNGGNDSFLFKNGDGSDLIDGGAGHDSFEVQSGDAMIVNLAAGTARGSAAGTAVLVSIEDVEGNSGNDVLTGNGVSNRLIGKSGNDTLDGRGAGSDVLDGGANEDTYIIDAGDTIIDASGIDLVQSSAISLNLSTLGGGQIENAQLLGSANLNITGNGGKNVITGNAGKNTLTGGADDDTFVFNTRLSSAKADRITDFNRIDDVMHLENTGSGLFTGLTAGALASTKFKANAAGVATDSNDRIIYDTTSGDLFFDRNGSAAGGAIKFATLTNKSVITAADFFVI